MPGLSSPGLCLTRYELLVVSLIFPKREVIVSPVIVIMLLIPPILLVVLLRIPRRMLITPVLLIILLRIPGLLMIGLVIRRWGMLIVLRRIQYEPGRLLLAVMQVRLVIRVFL